MASTHDNQHNIGNKSTLPPQLRKLLDALLAVERELETFRINLTDLRIDLNHNLTRISRLRVQLSELLKKEPPP